MDSSLNVKDIFYEPIPYYEEIIEAMNPIYDIDEEEEIALESSSKNFIDPATLNEMQVVYCNFPYLYTEDDGNSGKFRYGLIVKDEGELKIVMCSAVNSKNKERKQAKYQTNYLIKYYKKYGFDKETMVVCNVILPLSYVKNITHRGFMDKYEYNIVMRIINSCKKSSFSDPFTFLSWLVSHHVTETIPVDGKNNNSNKLQSIMDVRESNAVNCVDIVSCVRILCNKKGIKHLIVKTDFKDPDIYKYSGHVYVIFDYKNVKRVFMYIPRENTTPYAKIIDYPGKNIDQIIDDQVKFLKPHFDEVFGCSTIPHNRILDEDDVIVWDEALSKKTTQKEMLDSLFEPERLLERISKFEWGCVVDGKNIFDDKNNDCWKKYRTLSPDEFEYSECGCCWDYVMYQNYYLKALAPLLKLSNWCIESAPMGNDSFNHTWMSYKKGNHYYLFEASWKNYISITRFDTEEEMIDYYINLNYKGIKVPNRNFVVYQYSQPQTGLSVAEFMLYIINKGKLKIKNGDYHTYIRKMYEGGYTYDEN